MGSAREANQERFSVFLVLAAASFPAQGARHTGVEFEVAATAATPALSQSRLQGAGSVQLRNRLDTAVCAQ